MAIGSLTGMFIHRMLMIVVALSLLAAACGGDSINASNCEELTDETVAMFQRLVDEIDSEYGDVPMEDVLVSSAPLPSIEEFEEDVAILNELTTELGCDRDEIGAAIQSRASEITSESDLGRFLIESIRAGSL
jgi:NifB/MoaA-like Fe-S oxidoreductase